MAVYYSQEPTSQGCVRMGITRTLPWSLLLLTALSGCTPSRPPSAPPETALYLWQRAWNDDVRESVAKAPDHAAHLMVLVSEAGTAPIAVDWDALATTGLPVTLVFRYPHIPGDTRYAPKVLADVERAERTARIHRLVPEGVQLDFDSPTSKLADYAALLRAIRPELTPGIKLSITALPTWLPNRDFIKLARLCDYYVLQVHSFERPESIDTPLVLCDTAKVPDYVAQASKIGVPFYVAFPTHGYEVAYDATGHFAGLSAEQPEQFSYPPGVQTREVRADPAEIAGAVAKLHANPPDGYRGNVWFRMPVAGDTRNWTWSTLAAVMDGRAPTVAYRAEIRHPDPGLAEIWLAPEGEDRAPAPVEVTLSVPRDSVLAYDCVNGFHAATGTESGEVILKGTAPVGEEPILLAWYRMRDARAADAVKVRNTGDSR